MSDRIKVEAAILDAILAIQWIENNARNANVSARDIQLQAESIAQAKQTLNEAEDIVRHYGPADELRDLQQTVLECRTLDDLVTTQKTVRAILALDKR